MVSEIVKILRLRHPGDLCIKTTKITVNSLLVELHVVEVTPVAGNLEI